MHGQPKDPKKKKEEEEEEEEEEEAEVFGENLSHCQFVYQKRH